MILNNFIRIRKYKKKRKIKKLGCAINDIVIFIIVHFRNI